MNEQQLGQFITINFLTRRGLKGKFGVCACLASVAHEQGQKELWAWFEEIHVRLLNMCPEFGYVPDARQTAMRYLEALPPNEVDVALRLVANQESQKVPVKEFQQMVALIRS